MREWLDSHATLLGWLSILSVATCVIGLLATPWLVARIPADYFLDKKRHALPWANHSRALRILLILGKNLLGLLLLVVGTAMLVLPGPGLPTLLAGTLLIDFPGKYRLERWLIARRPVAAALNWMRKKSGAQPLELPPDC